MVNTDLNQQTRVKMKPTESPSQADKQYILGQAQAVNYKRCQGLQ